jgi:tetratricopeptide (TPR) repeat protein
MSRWQIVLVVVAAAFVAGAGCLFKRACDFQSKPYSAVPVAVFAPVWKAMSNPESARALFKARRLEELGGELMDDRQYARAEAVLKEGLKLTERHLGADDFTCTGSFLRRLIDAYSAQGKLTEATMTCRRLLATTKKTCGPDHFVTARELERLSWLLSNQGQYRQAESLLARALAIHEKGAGPESCPVAGVLVDLAGVHERQGRCVSAESHLQRALAVCEGSDRCDDYFPYGPASAFVLRELAQLCSRSGRHAEAEAYLGRANEIARKHPETNGAFLLSLALLLADVKIDRGDYASAEQLCARNLQQAQKLRNRDRGGEINALIDLFRLRLREERYSQAESVGQQIRVRLKDIQPEPVPDMVLLESHLASLYAAWQKDGEAEKHFARAAELSEKHGLKTLQVRVLCEFACDCLNKGEVERAGKALESAGKLAADQAIEPLLSLKISVLTARFEFQRGRFQTAQALAQKTLAQCEANFGPTSTEVAGGLALLGDVDLFQGKHLPAEPYYARAMRIYDQQLVPYSPEATWIRSRLAEVLAAKGEGSRARELARRALAICLRHPGANEWRLSAPLHALANVERDGGDPQKAELLYKRAMLVNRKAFHGSEPAVIRTLEDYARCLRKMGRNAEAASLERQAVRARSGRARSGRA